MQAVSSLDTISDDLGVYKIISNSYCRYLGIISGIFDASLYELGINTFFVRVVCDVFSRSRNINVRDCSFKYRATRLKSRATRLNIEQLVFSSRAPSARCVFLPSEYTLSRIIHVHNFAFDARRGSVWHTPARRSQMLVRCRFGRESLNSQHHIV
jgi:hypothetical protein